MITRFIVEKTIKKLYSLENILKPKKVSITRNFPLSYFRK
jgi:hypothetical protein